MIKVVAATAVVLLGVSAKASAQIPKPQPGIDQRFDVMILKSDQAAGHPVAIQQAGMEFLSMPVEIAGEAATGAPYSAEAVTEVVQPLADGNRIVRESRAAVDRDSAGRIRREHGLAIVGGLVSGQDRPQNVQISDPKSGVSYVLDVTNRRVMKLSLPPNGAVMTAAAAGSDVFQIALPPPPSGARGAVFYRAEKFESLRSPVVERLGKQSMEGVEVEGTRSTITIPAGEIGNEQPIRIVSERWYSPDLKVLVLSRQSDPRFGETTYRLTNILRAEPAPELFEVPSDFTLVEPGAFAGQAIRIDRK